MSPAKRTRKELGARRKTGINTHSPSFYQPQNCRTRRIKCDENTPCGYCARRHLECKLPEFIVPQGWSPGATTTATQLANDTSRSLSTSTHHLESTYDIFQQVPTPAPITSLLVAQPERTGEETLSKEAAELLKIYQRGIGTWMDIFDHSYTYQRQVVRYALASTLLLRAICALSAKQMSLIQGKYLWESISSRLYGESLALLIKELTDQTASREVLLSATILLCGYELLAAPSVDYQRHLYGARTLLEAYSIASEGTRFEHASFWIYARQDVASAIANERATLIPPAQWPDPRQYDEPEEDQFGKSILRLLAKTVDLVFATDRSQWSTTNEQQCEELTQAADSLWHGLPSSARGVETTNARDSGIAERWFVVPSAASGCLYYHLAKILGLEYLMHRSRRKDLEEETAHAWADGIQLHCLAIASICLSSDIPDGVLIVAVNPLFYAARHIRDLSHKFKLWTVLEDIETRLGFHTKDRIQQLQREFKQYTNANS